MPLQTRTYDLREERERLEAEREELAAEVAALDPDNPERQEHLQRGQQLDAYLDGLDAVIDPPEEVAIPQFDTVGLGGLTGGEYGQIEDQLVSAALNRGDDSVGSGAERIHLVAKGTVDATYLDDGMGYEQQIAATAQLPLGYLKWAEAKIDEMTSVGNGERESFESLVAASSQNEPSNAADGN
jgi:hypothetical protein